MIEEVFLAVIQAATEFLPISSSGHLALFSNYFSQPNIFFFTVLHLASLLAVIIYTRRELLTLTKLTEESKQLWKYLIIATIPAALFGLIFHNLITFAFTSYAALAAGFFFTGIILLFTKYTQGKKELTNKKSFYIGIMQMLALFPGVSRSGMTISTGLLQGIERKKAARFSFLLFIPLSLGAFFLEIGNFYVDGALILAFFITFFTSLLFLNILEYIIKKGQFWWFSIYCFLIGLLSLLLHLL